MSANITRKLAGKVARVTGGSRGIGMEQKHFKNRIGGIYA
jgi:hypothetical protein